LSELQRACGSCQTILTVIGQHGGSNTSGTCITPDLRAFADHLARLAVADARRHDA